MRNVLWILTLLLVSGCASVGNVTSFSNATDTEHLQRNERRLWQEAANIDQTFDRSGQIYRNKRATSYVQGIMDKLYPEFKGKIHVHLYDSTRLNAFALPNGSVYVNIGLLAHIENEAQIAAVLGHEATHFIEKHSLKERVHTKNAAAFALSGIPFSRLAATSSISGFSRAEEREADAKGYKRLVRAGYDPREAPKVFQHLADEVDALGIKEPYFFSSHPKLVDRINGFKRMSRGHKGGGRIGSRRYNRIMSSIRLDVLRKDIGQDRFKSVILVMEDNNMKRYFPAASYFYLGEAYNRRDNKGDKVRALKAYRTAQKLAPRFAPSYMRLGMHYMKEGNKSKARHYLRRYLRLAPKDAPDRPYIQQYLKSL